MEHFALELRSPILRSFLRHRRLVLALVLSAAIRYAHAIDGQVLDEATNQPIADAIVVVRWEATSAGIPEAHRTCLHVESARTDAQGRYHIEDWRGFWAPQNWLLSDRQVHFDAYKADYVWSFKDRPKPEILYLAAFKGTVEERFAYLITVTGMNCGLGDGSMRFLYRLNEAVYEEARSIAETSQQRSRVQWFLHVANELLVNPFKPTTTDGHGNTINVNPADSYKREELLK